MGICAVIGVAVAAQAEAMRARQERIARMSPEQLREYRAREAEAAMLKDKARAAQMFKAAAKSSTDCPWKRFRKGEGI